MPPLNLPTPSKDPSPGRRLPGGPRLESFTLELKTVTPILGGGPVTRRLSDVDIIRVPTLRGHLRFWWRALYGYSYADGGDDARLAFARKERELWGGMGLGAEEPRRSQVELWVRKVQDAGQNPNDIGQGDPQSYALWPARETNEDGPAPRWNPGLGFTLEVRAPEGEAMLQVRNAFRAWLLFDGYGSRTRRGCGAVTLVSPKDCQHWLPKNASRTELRRLFGDLPLFQPELAGEGQDLPLLRGARLYRNLKGEAYSDANTAWMEALGWLRDFRQGTYGTPGERPRNPSPVGDKRAGRSNWPEADKIRHHARPSKPGPDSRAYPEEHSPRSAYPRPPVWPRAGFGLPIVFHFQQKQRGTKEFYSRLEPENVQLQWMTNKGDVRDRLGSPLIVKAMPLESGRFEPIALWLERGYPKRGQVVLVQGKTSLDATRADFDKLSAEQDQPLFNPLRRSKSLREAFFTWLGDTRKAQEA